MKVLVLAAKLIDVPDSAVDVDPHYMDTFDAQKIAEQDTAPFERFVVVPPTRKGFFTFGMVREMTNCFALWAGKQVGQPMPQPLRQKQLWMSRDERDAYDRSLL